MLLGEGRMKILAKYLRVWVKTTLAVFSADLANRFGAFVFIFGKVLRFLFFLGFLYLLVGKTKVLADYSLSQIVFFFLTFNLIDITSQLFLRGVYHFRPKLISGNFDLTLVKPINPLFNSLTAHTDVLDLITLIPLTVFMIFFAATHGLTTSFANILLYLALVSNAFVLSLSFHIVVLAFGIITLEVDHLIWMHRDFSGMGRIPVDIYKGFLRSFLTFIIPVGVLMTFPAKALMGLLQAKMVFYSFFLAFFLFYLSLRFWNFALTRYTSASS